MINRACRQKQNPERNQGFVNAQLIPVKLYANAVGVRLRRDNCRPPADVWHIDRSGNREPPVSQFSNAETSLTRVPCIPSESIPSNDRHSSTDAAFFNQPFSTAAVFTFAFQIQSGDIHRRHRKRRDASATIVNMLFHKVRYRQSQRLFPDSVKQRS